MAKSKQLLEQPGGFIRSVWAAYDSLQLETKKHGDHRVSLIRPAQRAAACSEGAIVWKIFLRCT
jgi:hypothetical protein